MAKKDNSSIERRHFILVDTEENWKASLDHGLWGFIERGKGFWNKTNTGDYLIFYVMKPLKKIIGFGAVGEKLVNDDLIWNDEKLFKRSIRKFKFEIKPVYVCKNWDQGIELPPMLLMMSRKLISKDLFFQIVKNADVSWNTDLKKELF